MSLRGLDREITGDWGDSYWRGYDDKADVKCVPCQQGCHADCEQNGIFDKVCGCTHKGFDR